MKTILACCLSLCLLLAALPAGAQNDVVNSAMRDELDRSMKTLQLEKLEKPYFIAYRTQEYTGTGASASLGSLLYSNTSHSRFLAAEMPEGHYALRNTNLVSSPDFPDLSRISPHALEVNYEELL